MIKKGAIIKVTENGKYADVEISRRELVRCLLLNPYGDTSNIKADGSSQAIVIYPQESYNHPIALPFNVPLQPTTLAEGEKSVGNYNVGNSILFAESGDINAVCVGGNFNITATEVDVTGNVNTSGVYKVGDTQVVGAQQGAIADATGGSVIDVEARAVQALILTALRTHGLIDT